MAARAEARAKLEIAHAAADRTVLIAQAEAQRFEGLLVEASRSRTLDVAPALHRVDAGAFGRRETETGVAARRRHRPDRPGDQRRNTRSRTCSDSVSPDSGPGSRARREPVRLCASSNRGIRSEPSK